jgi:hypothetical protein
VVVPFWSSSLVVARHLPHGRSPGGDRHLKFYEARDNLGPARRWIMWAGAYKDFAPVLFVLLCLQLLIAVSLIYSVVLSLGRWKVPAPPPVARLWKQVIHLPLMESAWLSSLEGWKLAVLLLALPAVAALLWLRAFRVPLIGSYIGALVLPPGVLMFIVAVVLWIPDFVEFAIKRARGWTVGLPGPVPWRLRRTFP